MRLFRSSRDKRSGSSDNEDSLSSHSHPDESPQKSLFRSMGHMFIRSPKRNNDHLQHRIGTPSSTLRLSDEIVGAGKPERRGWFSRFSDSSSMKCESVTSKSMESNSPNSLDDPYMIDNSVTSLSLSPLSLKGYDDENIDQTLELQPMRGYGQWDRFRREKPARSLSKDTIMLNDEVIQVGGRYNTAPFVSTSDDSDFEIKHASGINLNNNPTFDNNIWFYDDEANKEQKKVVKERNFFNIRSKFSNAHKTSQSKALKLTGAKSHKPGQKADVPRTQESPTTDTPSPKVGPSITSKDHKVIKLTNEPTNENIEYEVDHEYNKKIEDIFTMPLLQDTPPANRPELFQKKLIACQTVVDFDPRKQMQRAIELKRHILLEIIDYISTTRNCINERILQDVIDMLSSNVFRTLPQNPKKLHLYDAEEDEPTLEKSWPHLQIVYDVFLRVIVSNDVTSKMARNAIDKTFVLKLLDTLNSEDQRERDYLKTILHRIYGKIVPLRNFIRKAIENVFVHFVYDTEVHHGITELLEILGSIINGFAIPLKEEHKLYLRKALAPLHRPNSLKTYYQPLSYCMIQYINKDRTLSATILKSILTYWPTANSQKEILFLYELEDVLSLTELPEFNLVITPLMKRIKLCLCSMHFQVAERTLSMWNNERIVRLFNMTKNAIYPVLVPVLHENSNTHWNAAVRAGSFNICKLLSDSDPQLYNQSMELFNQDQVIHDHAELWDKLEICTIVFVNYIVKMAEIVEKLDTNNMTDQSGELATNRSKPESVNEEYTGARIKSKEQPERENNVTITHTVIVKKVPSKDFTNFKQMESDTPVCHLLYEDIDNGSFYLQWKPNSSEEYKNSVLMMVPEKNVPKFKLMQDGGRAPLSHKVAPDKMKFYSCLCQFLKLAKDYNAKFQLMPAWASEMAYKCDLYLHFQDNRVVKVDTEHAVLEGVNCVAVVGTSTRLSSKMTREQFVTAVRNVGYALTF
ncbi:protein phosphatase 2A regulatory subunit B [Theileria orientalis]|uniref:Protein phosphatase 2A regulatory subunit B n=1 Tax=Theileria orientalis TaxID=68886 RepID=A0A976QU34_THEOR|nr:protein phosphatase 2A regulatory subunit B [Theileria orientalis]